MSTSYDKKFDGRVDAYRICRLYNVNDHAIYHAIKKLIRSGDGEKSIEEDVEEAIMSLERWQEMEKEDRDEIHKGEDAVLDILNDLKGMGHKTFQPVLNGVEKSDTLPSMPNFVMKSEHTLEGWLEGLTPAQRGELRAIIENKKMAHQ